MKRQNNTIKQAPNAEDFLGGNYLRKEDIRGPQSVTVIDVWSEKFLGASRPKLIIEFEEIEKPLVLNKTNTKRLMIIFDTPDTSQWRGCIVLYVESGVEYAGQVVGGIRLQEPQQLQATTSNRVNANRDLQDKSLWNGLEQ
jgi:hypothetical protein